MFNSSLTALAANLAQKAHGGEIARTGGPAFEHYAATARSFDTEEEACVAYLCDALDTGKVTEEDLRFAQFPDEVVEACVCLKRGEGEEFFDFIERIKGNSLASRVKRADLVQTIEDMESYVSLTGMDRRRRTSCQKALDIIDGTDELAYDGLFESQHHHGKKKTPVPPAPHMPAER